MELDYDSRPVSAMHRGRDWGTAALNGSSTSPVATSSNFASRRRSTAGHTPPPPPGPPPSQPIPSLPPVMGLSRYEPYDGMPDASGSASDVPNMNATYSRPSPSPGLAAVTAFSQARYASVSNTGYPSPTLSGSSTDNLADSPPPSILRSPTAQPPAPAQELSADRLLMPPTDQRSSNSRPSSRRALTKALELAREAVRLDSTNDDPHGAVMAYAKSVALLSEVMERVMRGEDSTESSRRRNGRRRSVVAQEEEVRRLKSIHDTYADRMNILSVVYDIPLPPHSPPSGSSISVSSDSTRPSSPSSISPTSEASDVSSHPHSPSRSRERESRFSSETARADNVTDDEGSLSRNSSYTNLSPLASGRPLHPAHGTASPVHPYAAAVAPVSVSPVGSTTGSRTSVIRSRPRASSTLPPPAPPPTTLPPPAPSPTRAEYSELTPTQTLRPVDIVRSRGNSISHKRTSSGGRLAALREESLDSGVSHESTHPIEEPPRSRSRLNVHPHQQHGSSPPLPPLPPPSAIDAATPRNPGTLEPSSPPAPGSPGNFMTPRPRGGSTLSVRSEVTPTSKPTLINTSPAMGTISQRRTKTSAPPTSGSDAPSPTDSTASAASVPNMGTRMASALPASTVSSLGIGGRSRASSQPGRRPSIVTANSYPSPYPASQGGSSAPRKVSIPSRLNPSAPPQITVNTAILSPPLTLSALSLTSPPLVPPPPIPYANIPAAPLSPLPTSAPPDPQRKPYHMMFLLRQTMTSKTGGYITRRLHVPQEVWSQGGAKLTNVPEKIRVVEVLCSALEELQHWSAEYFGAGNVSSGMAMGIGAIGRKEGESWASKLEDFSTVCDGVVGQFGKKLGVGEGFITKKSSGVTSWGGRLTRQFDKITNGKNLDSPALYVQGLSKLFLAAQILDEHTKAASPSAIAPLYAAFPPDIRAALDNKLRHASEFFAKVVLTFVIRDMALLLDKYVKKCEKWLAE
ncbi:hypothetical protein L226DRAFT_451220 [Lentinus tigrinus ALCF2SS1-7]|uniref:MIT domain-containing protein n=1 Tax=Lentinus tigrinus ALCF2SS1-6 TaxID=1328759 RepID=A0A5C2SH26_9APHY|nr:hypothetical protein L227DRAFT_497960 [Lentinus tigrinus ALCF2SS1-6]RPD81828.1 hypothetical protein L226DRAFT_451220 [Lentinus tigrinus ALCF2SS1-7]